ncbi:MAGE family-domain-containing protein [Chaetomium sp. MPI-SDFR-AT-0129]|nr:MAGE family-domain-containing protein [Chaetomium sp. MPI-SDFR-AT-0129]
MSAHNRRRRTQIPDEEDDEVSQQRPPSPGSVDGDGDEQMGGVGQRDEISQLVKNLVRYALACEYSRTPIRREGIRDKVLGSQGRAFKKVFAGAQKQLRATFGMEMVELPTRDRNTLTAEQKRKAAKSQSQPKETSSNTYVLTSVLPEQYTTPAIIAPSKVGSADGEASYIALYTMIIAIITLSGGSLSEPRLRRYLTRLNVVENMPSMNPSDETSPSERTDSVLQRMIKQGYLLKVTESRSAGDEDATNWYIGPRGKVEADNEVIAAFVRTVYGGSNEELEGKIQASLKVRDRMAEEMDVVEEEEPAAPENGDPGPSTRRSGRRRQTAEDEDDG